MLRREHCIELRTSSKRELPEDRAMRLAMELWEPHTPDLGDNINNDDTLDN